MAGVDGRHARFMMRWMSRITLEVTEVRVQRLSEISDADARAEGFTSEPQPGTLVRDGKRASSTIAFFDPRVWFSSLWASINGVESLKANPWVWAMTFRVLK